MSIINKMLQDLDSRQGMSGSEAMPAIAQVRSVGTARGQGEWFWRVIAALMIVSLGWVAWIAWQLQPREPIATALAFKAAEGAKRTSIAPAQAVALTPAPSQPSPVAAPPAVAPPAAPPVATPPVVAPVAASAAETQKPVASAVELVRRRVAAQAPPPEQPAHKAMSASAVPAKTESRTGGPARLDLDVPPARILAAPAAVASRVQKQDRTRSAEERAESEFRRGAGLLNQGRVSEAEEAFAAALAISPSHGSARQALIALYLEQRRIDDAQKLLQEGLAANPANAQFALVLARIHAGRREYPRALEILNAARANAHSNPEFDALLGNVMQGQGRHAEAADAFRAALRASPGNGPAWAGLGISLEAQGRRPEAIEAFQRAIASAPAGSELAGFAEQRLRALR